MLVIRPGADAVYVEIGCDLLRFDLDQLSWFTE